MDFQIWEDISAIENFIRLNELPGYPRKIVPITSSQQPFVSFSEKELVAFFWKREPLERKLLQMAALDGLSGGGLQDVQGWIRTREPGFLIKRLLVGVDPQGLTKRKREKVGHHATVSLLSSEEIKTHLQDIENPLFNPADYHRKGYVLRGSLKSNGFRVQLIAFKLKELQMVRYRRLPDGRLPLRLLSTVGGVDHWLQETRNVIKTRDNVERFWPGVPPQNINTLTLDAGQAYIVGAFAHISSTSTSAPQGPAVASTSSTVNSALTQGTATIPPTESEPAIFMNLAVNQKAVYQLTFRTRRRRPLLGRWAE
ncbi:hypothetical protein EDD21DRAFT_406599 [Dissophora ornata]|nr:hypothetical protein EDD21DRAFT_406599 [Dissophora ornata]